MVTANSQPSPGAYDPCAPGTLVDGRYELRRIVGRGGAAVVFAAEHVRIRRWVALKLPLNHPDYRELVCARLRRETAAIALVRHPAVVDVVDAGEWEGLPYLAMELLEGRSLSSLIAARGRLSPEAVIKIGTELASGLAATHAAGVLHRDVKPDNVLITRSPAEQVHLCDFGIAAMHESVETSDRKLTASGALLGTLEYMPLESLTCSPADQRADVYALGVTLFECLTGVVPCEGPIAKILVKLSTNSMPSITSIRPDVPPPLAAIVTRCLAPEPAGRYNSMQEIADELRKLARQPSDRVDLMAASAASPVGAAPTVSKQGGPAPAPAPAAQPQGLARRVHPRAPYAALTSLQRTSGASNDARIEDLSEGGVLVVARETYAAGDTLRIRFGLPISGRILAVPALVRWSRVARGSPVIGLEFKELPDAARKEIRQYVALMGGDKGPAA
jgi:serine/threonine-protein kinase